MHTITGYPRTNLEDTEPIRRANERLSDHFNIEDSIIGMRLFNVKRLPLRSVDAIVGSYILTSEKPGPYTTLRRFYNTETHVGRIHALLRPIDEEYLDTLYLGNRVLIPVIAPTSRCALTPNLGFCTATHIAVSAQRCFVPINANVAAKLLASAFNDPSLVQRVPNEWRELVDRVATALVATASNRTR